MAMSPVSEVIQHLRRIVLLRDDAHRTDGQLLEDYLRSRDEAALEVLVRRHGPMVWGVCRRVLHNHHDAEDAFQATFLVLVRKAAAILPREMVTNWLYGVAHQTALKARATAARRKGRERQLAEMPHPVAPEQGTWNDLQAVLDDALCRLPATYRAAIVLCDLEGKTRREVAQQLGLPEGTVGSRLARARAMLAKRLARHGLGVSGGALAAVLSQNASASVPIPVVSSTIKAASLFAKGPAVARGAISVKVAALTEGVLKTMFLTKLKAVSVVLVIVGALSGAAGLSYQTQAKDRPKTQAATEKPEKLRLPAAKKPETKKDEDRLQGEWKLDDAEIGGRTDPNLKELRKIKWVIRGNKITIGNGDGADATGSVKLDLTKKPKEIDITLTAGGPPAGHRTYPGIYKLDDDKLTVCYAFQADKGQPRPTEFDSKAGAKLVVFVRSKQKKATGKNDKEMPPFVKGSSGPLQGLVKAQAEETRAKIEELNQALWNGEYTKAVDRMPSYLIAKQGGREKMRAAMKRVMEKMKSRYTLRAYQVGDPVLLVRGSDWVVAFPTATELGWAAVVNGTVTDPTTGTVATSHAFAVGISQDSGKTWKYVNGDQHVFRDHVEDFFGQWLRLPALSTVEAEGLESQ